jgi:hypothetical protein
MITSFKDFMNNLIVEELHPELQHIVKSVPGNGTSKQTILAKKIKELSSRGEHTGIEGNMPKGSSRAYMKHNETYHTTVDDKPAKFSIGTKVAIKSRLDKHHDKKKYDNLSLGQLQNRTENDDGFIDNHRVLIKNHDSNSYETNHDGIFPPLVHHDEQHHNYSTVGHSRDIKAGEFRHLTKTTEHPEGISHNEFTRALNRDHQRNIGKHWPMYDDKHLDHIEKHPLVQKFLNYHRNTGQNPYDYGQQKNMGIFEHPNGSKHIVARDHGFDNHVAEAYKKARMEIPIKF